MSSKYGSPSDIAVGIDGERLAVGPTEPGPEVLQNESLLACLAHKCVECHVARRGRPTNNLSFVIDVQRHAG